MSSFFSEAKPGLHGCVVQRTAAFAEGNDQAVPLGQAVPFMCGELVAAVGMDDATRRGSANLNRFGQRAQRRLRSLIGVGGPADDLPTVRIEDDRRAKE